MARGDEVGGEMSDRTPMVIKKGSLEKCVLHMIQSGAKYKGHQLAIVQHAGISGSMVVLENEAYTMAKEGTFAGFRIVMCMTTSELRRFVGYAQLNLFPGGEVGDDPTAI